MKKRGLCWSEDIQYEGVRFGFQSEVKIPSGSVCVNREALPHDIHRVCSRLKEVCGVFDNRDIA
jgi:hypothetical protein